MNASENSASKDAQMMHDKLMTGDDKHRYRFQTGDKKKNFRMGGEEYTSDTKIQVIATLTINKYFPELQKKCSSMSCFNFEESGTKVIDRGPPTLVLASCYSVGFLFYLVSDEPLLFSGKYQENLLDSSTAGSELENLVIS